MNTKVFKIGNKEISVKKISLLDQMQVREACYDDLKVQNKTDLKELCDMLPEVERGKFLLDALKKLTPTEEQIDEYFTSKNGMLKVLGVALGIDQKTVIEYINEDWDTTLEMYRFAMDVEEEEDSEKNLEEATTK